MADNPPCTSWCEADHDTNDFRVQGDFHCSRPIGLLGVTVGYYRVANEDTPFQVDEGPQAWIIDVLPKAPETMTASIATQLARDLLEAADFCRAVAS